MKMSPRLRTIFFPAIVCLLILSPHAQVFGHDVGQETKFDDVVREIQREQSPSYRRQLVMGQDYIKSSFTFMLRNDDRCDEVVEAIFGGVRNHHQGHWLIFCTNSNRMILEISGYKKTWFKLVSCDDINELLRTGGKFRTWSKEMNCDWLEDLYRNRKQKN